MAPAYKLKYFDIVALGEPIRLLLSYGNIEFENEFVSAENWTIIKPTLSPTLPYGQLPILEHKGKVAHQHLAIARYVAKQVKLMGSNDWEDLEIDSVIDTVNDFRCKIRDWHYEQNEMIKEHLKGPLFAEVIPFYVGKLEEETKKNKGFLAAGKFTWADVYFASILEYMNIMAKQDLTEKAPGLKAIDKKVRAIPQIKAYIEKRGY